MAKDPILDLQTLIERPIITIDGKSFELFSPDELSVLDSEWFSIKGREISEASESDDLSAVEDHISEVVKRCVVDLPDHVFDQLKGAHKVAISELFTQLLSHRKTRVAGAIAMAVLENRKPIDLPTGGKSSLGSSVSSGAIRSGGSTKPRPHS